MRPTDTLGCVNSEYVEDVRNQSKGEEGDKGLNDDKAAMRFLVWRDDSLKADGRMAVPRCSTRTSGVIKPDRPKTLGVSFLQGTYIYGR